MNDPVIRRHTPGRQINGWADIVVIGTGAGGSMVTYEAARAGRDVLAIELGAWLDDADMTGREDEMIPRLYAEAGARSTSDRGINVLQGIGVGGSTLHNTNLCRRLPVAIREHWEEHHNVRLDGFDDDAKDVETLLNVHPVPDDAVNTNNRVFERGMQQLGWRGGRLSHNRDARCQRSGLCELGCPNDGKVNGRRLMSEAIRHGARVLTLARVEELHHDGRNVHAVSGSLLCGETHRPVGRFRVSCRQVVMAGSATSSAALFLHSRVPCRVPAGRTLRLHPGIAVMGLHDELIEGFRGIPQSVECTEFLDLRHGSDRRVWLVSGFAHPAGAAALLPSFGQTHHELMRQYAHASCAIAMVHDESCGTVRPGAGSRVHIDYRLNVSDQEQLVQGVRQAVRLLLAGGAREVVVPLSRPVRVTCEDDLQRIDRRLLHRYRPALTAVHPMGTLPMGTVGRGVCDPTGRVHSMNNLWVADGSLFPTSIGGPPQLTIYTLARRVARAVVAST